MGLMLLALVHRGCRQLFQSSLHALCTEPEGQKVFYGQTLPTCVYLCVLCPPWPLAPCSPCAPRFLRVKEDVSFLHAPVKQKLIFAVHFLLTGTQFLPHLSG